jgi:antitoxin VapB
MIDTVGIYHSPRRFVKKAKLFMNGRSQAVRLPKEFRMPGSEVYVERRGEELVIRPVKSPAKLHGKPLKTLGDLFDYIAEAGPVGEEFERAILEAREQDRRHPPREFTW